MDKIAFITFHKAYNYGAFLQTFALNSVLSGKYDCYVYDYTCKKIKNDYKLIKKNNFKKMVKSLLYLTKNYKRKQNFDKCINSSFKFVNNDNDLSLIIAGSDQIWNIVLTGGYDKYYSLEAFNSIKKISYASSVGDERLIGNNKDIYKKMIEGIDRVSVREESAKKELSKISDKKVDVCLDPTLLLSEEDWKKYLKKPKYNSDYIFSYFVGVTKNNYLVLDKLSSKLQKKVLSYSENPKESNKLDCCYTDDPFQFITNIYNSSVVFTSSFHATVFSIIFNKEFYCMIPKNKGNRIINLLNKLGLNSRMINEVSDLEKIDFNKKIDYSKVNSILESERKKSLDWLFDNIGDVLK